GGGSGGWEGSVTCAGPPGPPASVTATVTVCVPCDRVVVVKLPPCPMTPSLLDVQVSVAVMSPSVASIAVAVKVSGRLAKTSGFAAGGVLGTTRGLGGPGTRDFVGSRAPRQCVAGGAPRWRP